MFTKPKERQRHFDSLWCQRKGRIQSVRKSEFSVPRSPCFSRAPEEYSNLCVFNGVFATYLLLKDPFSKRFFFNSFRFSYIFPTMYTVLHYILFHTLKHILRSHLLKKHDSRKKTSQTLSGLPESRQAKGLPFRGREGWVF